MTSTKAEEPIGGYWREVDFQKLGPALLIASSLALAIRTAKWSPIHSDGLATVDWDKEVEHSARLAKVVLSHLTARNPELFQVKNVPWFVATDEDVPKWRILFALTSSIFLAILLIFPGSLGQKKSRSSGPSSSRADSQLAILTTQLNPTDSEKQDIKPILEDEAAKYTKSKRTRKPKTRSPATARARRSVHSSRQNSRR